MAAYERVATDIEKQIHTLKLRGLLIEDREYAKNALLQIGYFRFKGYCLPYYEKKDSFKEGISFSYIYNNYRFDERLRLLFFQIIEHVEVELKSIIGYRFSLENGPLGYYNNIYFYDDSKHSLWLSDHEIAIKKALTRNESFPQHYVDNYENQFPLWVAFEMTTFGNLSKFFANINSTLQKQISLEAYNIHPTLLRSWMYILSAVRNMCAHTSRLYDKFFPFELQVPKNERFIFPVNKPFIVVYICKKICLDEDYFNRFYTNLKELIRIYTDWIDLDKIGFPENWEEIIEKA